MCIDLHDSNDSIWYFVWSGSVITLFYSLRYIDVITTWFMRMLLHIALISLIAWSSSSWVLLKTYDFDIISCSFLYTFSNILDSWMSTDARLIFPGSTPWSPCEIDYGNWGITVSFICSALTWDYFWISDRFGRIVALIL